MEAFDFVDSECLWKLPRYYEIPEKRTMTTIIQKSYGGFICDVMHEGQLTDVFPVRALVRQVCLLSAFMSLLAIDWIIRQPASQKDMGYDRDPSYNLTTWVLLMI